MASARQIRQLQICRDVIAVTGRSTPLILINCFLQQMRKMTVDRCVGRGWSAQINRPSTLWCRTLNVMKPALAEWFVSYFGGDEFYAILILSIIKTTNDEWRGGLHSRRGRAPSDPASFHWHRSDVSYLLLSSTTDTRDQTRNCVYRPAVSTALIWRH